MTGFDPEAWRRLHAPDIAAFIAAHAEEDVHALALRRPPGADWPWRLVLDQIAARQKAKFKMPEWLAKPDILLPPADVVEQASSSATARYKASLVRGEAFADLTAGAGVDTLALLEGFKEGIAIEADPATAAALAHNLPLLSRNSCAVWPLRAEDAAARLPALDLVYLDPQRRKEGRRGIFQLQDGEPDITALRDALLEKAPLLMLKTSPMLDIDAAMRTLAPVASVHVVEWRGDCREVLYLMRRERAGAPQIHGVILNDDGTARHDVSAPLFAAAIVVSYTPPARYLYEPSPAMQKAGLLPRLAALHGLAKLHPHTQLLTGNDAPADFPGRVFQVEGIYPASGKGLALRRASVTVRNFPMAAEALRRKLGLADGGDDTLFACTLADGKKALIHCRKS